MGLENEPHTTSTNLPFNPYKDTVIAAGISSPAPAVPKTAPSAPAAPVSPEKALGVTPAELVDLAPRLAQYVPHGTLTWPVVLDATDWLRGELGVSRTLWAQACQTMGRDRAALALAIVSTKPAEPFQPFGWRVFRRDGPQGRAWRTAPGTQPVGAARGPLWQARSAEDQLRAVLMAAVSDGRQPNIQFFKPDDAGEVCYETATTA